MIRRCQVWPILTMLVAVSALVLTSAVTPATARWGGGWHGGWRGVGIAAGIGAGLALGAAAANGSYGYGYPSYYGAYGYGGSYGYGSASPMPGSGRSRGADLSSPDIGFARLAALVKGKIAKWTPIINSANIKAG